MFISTKLFFRLFFFILLFLHSQGVAQQKQVVAFGDFDNIQSHEIRFLEEASKLGELTVYITEDEAILKRTGSQPKFSLIERLYFLKAIRYVSHVNVIDESCYMFPEYAKAEIYVDREATANFERETRAKKNNMDYHVICERDLENFPIPKPFSPPLNSERLKVIVTGCYDWFHSGHIRFFEEAAQYGDLYVSVGNDACISLLKGTNHPLFSENERLYVISAIRFVKQAFIASGIGWLDADAEIKLLKPDIYAVNEDGDKGGKCEYCQQNGIEYKVLKRVPAQGLPARSSTDLRGF